MDKQVLVQHIKEWIKYDDEIKEKKVIKKIRIKKSNNNEI